MASQVEFKKLLPKKMQPTKWGSFIDTYQSQWEDIRNEKVLPIINQYKVDKASNEELQNLGYFYGFDIQSYSGTYTATSEYFKRQVKSIVKRIKNKSNQKSYKYISSIYGLSSEVYPVIATTAGTFVNALSSTASEESKIYAVTETDQEGDNLYYIYNSAGVDYYIYGYPQSTGLPEAYTDCDNTIQTDNTDSTIISYITRNIIYSYKHKYLEESDTWLNKYTLKALEHDVNFNHKATERIYFEPWLNVEMSSDNQWENKTYFNYDQSISGQVNSFVTLRDLTNIKYIQFGTGNHYASGTPLSSISGVQSKSFFIPKTINSGEVISGVYNNSVCSGICGTVPSGVWGWNILNTSGEITSGMADFDFIISEKNKFTQFTEFALFNANSGIVVYSAFPKVQWNNSMYNNIRIKINLA